jgi:ECF transporter S component (folate family)
MKKKQKNDTALPSTEKGDTLGRISADLRAFGNVRVLCLAAMLCAMSYVLAYVAKMIFGLGPVRFTLENLPIVFGAVGFGPLVGALIAAGADLCSCIASGQGPNPLILVGSISVGLISGTVGRYILKSRRFLSLLLIELLTHTVASLIIKSLALHLYYGYALVVLLPRIPVYIAVMAIEAYAMWLLYRNRQVRTLLERIKKK